MVIYKTTNLLNDKIYIGKDARNLSYYLGSGIYIKNAIKKYGKHNFIKEILEHCDNLDLLNEREIYWINFYKSTDKNIGYNLSEGGEGGDLQKFKTHPHPNIGKTWEEIFGEERAKELREKCSAAWTGDKNPMFGKKLTPDHIEKLKKSNIGRERIFTDEHKKKISIALTGKKISEETKLKMSNARKGKKHKGLTVQSVDVDGNYNEFSSIEDAAIFFGVHKNKIRRNTIKNTNVTIIRDKHGGHSNI